MVKSGETCMSLHEGKYNIKAASKILGIQPGTLRAWERRYQMIAPVRNELGHRLYTDEHLKILKWLNKKVTQGFTIGQAVALMENNQLSSEVEQLQEGNQITCLSDELLDSLLHFNEMKAQEVINSLFSLFQIEKVIIDIFGPILGKIGVLRETSKITSAHEHFATSILRSRIGTIFYSLPQNAHLPKAIAACSPGEEHDIGLLIFSLIMRRKGVDVIFLGSSILEEDVEAVVKNIRPEFLFLSCTMPENLNSLLSIITKLSLNFKNLRIGIGGDAVNSMNKSEKEQFSVFIVGQTQEDWKRWLLKQLG